MARAVTAPAPALAVSALGLRFESPFGVAAGFDKDVRGAKGLHALGFGHVEVGTLTAIPQDGNPRPRLFRLIPDRAVVNRMGFNNRGAEAAAARLTKLRATREARRDRGQHRQEPRRRRRGRDRRLRPQRRRCSRRSRTTWW